jgi:CelD/BcsL family acetyltransferase involved in cellulose biosynthesis
LGKSLRGDCRRALNQLNLERVSVKDQAEAFSLLVAAHQKRWNRRGMPGSFAGHAMRFHARYLQLAGDQVRLYRARTPTGEWVGGLYTLHYKRISAYYQAGIVPSGAGSVSPGTGLIRYALEDAIREGDSTFDFLRGDEPYKRRWKPTHQRMNVRQMIPGKHWTTPLLLSSLRPLLHLQQHGKSWLESRLGPRRTK